MRAVGRVLRKQVVKAVLGRREGPLDIKAEALRSLGRSDLELRLQSVGCFRERV